MPVLEGEHRAPVQPEVGVEHLVVKDLVDALAIEVLVGLQEEVGDLHGALARQAELVVGVGVLALVLGHAAQRVVGVLFVEPVIVIEHRDVLVLDRGDRAEEVPHAFKVVVHLAAAAHGEAQGWVVPAVAGAAGTRVALEEVHVVAGHLGVADQEHAGGQGCQAGAHDVGRLVLDALGLLGMGKGLVVTCSVVHGVPPSHGWGAALGRPGCDCLKGGFPVDGEATAAGADSSGRP